MSAKRGYKLDVTLFEGGNGEIKVNQEWPATMLSWRRVGPLVRGEPGGGPELLVLEIGMARAVDSAMVTEFIEDRIAKEKGESR